MGMREKQKERGKNIGEGWEEGGRTQIKKGTVSSQQDRKLLFFFQVHPTFSDWNSVHLRK